MRNLLSLCFLLMLTVFSCREVEDLVETENDPVTTKYNTFIITSPTELENWYPDSTYSIKWHGSEIIEKVDILLYRKSDLILTIKSRLINNDSFQWTVPGDIPESHHYKIKIISSSDTSDYGYSSTFYIKSF